MSELDNQIVELTQLVNELEQKSAQTPIKPSDFNGIKKKTAEMNSTLSHLKETFHGFWVSFGRTEYAS